MTDEEAKELIRPEPKMGVEIVAGLERTLGGYGALIGFDGEDLLGVLPDEVIAAMRRTSIWDVYLDIANKCGTDLP